MILLIFAQVNSCALCQGAQANAGAVGSFDAAEAPNPLFPRQPNAKTSTARRHE